MVGGRCNHPAGAPRGAAQPLMEGDKGSNAFLQQKKQLFLSATRLHTAVQTVPLPFPPLCPSGLRQPLAPELSVAFFVLDTFNILTTTKPLQLYCFVQALARPHKAASNMEMVFGQCQQEEEGAVRETGEKYVNSTSAFQSRRAEKELWSVAAW